MPSCISSQNGVSYKALVFIYMCRFAVVVQNSGGVSTFYATCETDVINCKFCQYSYTTSIEIYEGIIAPKVKKQVQV